MSQHFCLTFLYSYEGGGKCLQGRASRMWGMNTCLPSWARLRSRTALCWQWYGQATASPPRKGWGGEAFWEHGARCAGVMAWAAHTRRGHEPWKQSLAWATEQARNEGRGQVPAGQLAWGHSCRETASLPSHPLEMRTIMDVVRPRWDESGPWQLGPSTDGLSISSC